MTLHQIADIELRAKLSLRQRMLQWARQHRGSLCFIGLPTLLASLYHLLIAADQYVSEARFVVRSPTHMQLPVLSSVLQGGIARSPGGDAYSVQDFILSRDALESLAKKTDIRAIFARPEADFLARYPNLIYGAAQEDFFLYYHRMIEVTYDTTSDICTLTVKAFRPEDAQLVAGLLLDSAEDLVNRLNTRARENTVRDAETEVHLAADHTQKAQSAILSYRNRESMLDPGKTSTVILENLARMEADLVTTTTHLDEIKKDSQTSPLRDALETHRDALAKQIAQQRSGLAGTDASMAPKIAEYEQLLLQKELTAKEFGAALDSLAAARAEARRQQTYLERVVEPGRPDKALYFTRIVSVLIIFISCFLLYSIGRLLVAGVREHGQD